MTNPSSEVRDARPPDALVRILNPLMRLLLPTPAGRLIRPFALIEFEGRRTGRHYRLPVGWHNHDGEPVVVSPAPWRQNFAGGLHARVHHRGRTAEMVGVLEADPTTVASLLQTMVDQGFPLARIGLRAPEGHRLSSDDIVAVNRAVIRFRAA